MSQVIDDHIEIWIKRIVRGNASLTDVPESDVHRIAQQLKAYADRYPDIGISMTVNRLTDELNAVEVTLNE